MMIVNKKRKLWTIGNDPRYSNFLSRNQHIKDSCDKHLGKHKKDRNVWERQIPRERSQLSQPRRLVSIYM